MRSGTRRSRLILDWAIPAVGLAGVLAWGAFLPKTEQDLSVSPFARFLQAAFTSRVGITYVCAVVIWWTYRLFQHGGWTELFQVAAIALQVVGLQVFFGTRPLLGLALLAAGLVASAVNQTRRGQAHLRG
jgi:hypothetical protein